MTKCFWPVNVPVDFRFVAVILSVFGDPLEVITHTIQGGFTVARTVEWYINSVSINQHIQITNIIPSILFTSMSHKSAYVPWYHDMWDILRNSLNSITNVYPTPSSRVSNSSHLTKFRGISHTGTNAGDLQLTSRKEAFRDVLVRICDAVMLTDYFSIKDAAWLCVRVQMV